MKKINSLIVFICLIALSSCDKFLDIQPVGRIIPKTAKEYRELLTKAYNIVPEDRGKATLRGDEFTMDGTNSSVQDIESYKDIWDWNDNNPVGYTLTFSWRQYYQALFYTNYIIENKENITQGTKEEINQLAGESYMVRAFLHFTLVNLFGKPYTACDPATEKGIPLKLNSNTEELLKRNTIAEVYTSVLSDLDKAESLMTKDQWETGLTYRFNTISVNAFRSRIYLYMGEWEKSFAASQAVLAKKSTLTDMRSSTVLPNNYKSDESIVALEQVMTSQFIKIGKVSSSLLAMYTSGDQRKAKYFSAVTMSNYQVVKGGNNEFRCSFRVGEIYLNAAEAASHIATKTEDAKTYLLKLMEFRYSVNAYNAKKTAIGTMTNEQLIAEIANERTRELAFEGHRWFDLRRTTRPRLEKTFVAKDGSQENYILEENDPRYTLRIPAEAIESNPELKN